MRPWLLLVLFPVLGAAAEANWSYAGNPAGQRYSLLRQINRDNVKGLKQVWRYDAAEQGDPETNPLVVDGVLYAYTPALKVVALDAATGRELWRYDTGLQAGQPSRGLSFWSDGKTRRLFAGVLNFLIALDPATGRPVTSFGDGGRVDLRAGLYGDISRHIVALTTPGVVYKDLIIVGFRTAEVHPAAPGDIRAFDVRTGRLRWTFHTIPRPGEPGYETWPKDAWTTAGAANNWSGMTLDEARGIVFAPTGSAASDFYGADRVGDDLYANSLIALNAATGKRLWSFQGVHHDIFDRDFPTAPTLLTVTRGGKRIDVVAQPTKQGFLFVLNRQTGEPVFPIEEVRTPVSQVPGEVAAHTQPHSRIPEPFARQHLTESMLTDRTEEAHAWALDKFRQMRSEGPFTPPGVDRPTVVFPGYDGGAEWGGAAVDPSRAVIYINANDVAWTAQLTDKVPQGGPAQQVYQQLCSACHGVDRRGSPPAIPSLMGVGERLNALQIESIINYGRGRMPAFGSYPRSVLGPVIQFVRTGQEPEQGRAKEMSFPAGVQDAYHFTGYNKFLDPDGYPAVAPPWGTLNAIDLNTGRYVWKIPLGEYPELVARGLKQTGSENYGGPVVTAGGLLFIGATLYDHKLRAFDAGNGTLLWETELPYAGTATPAIYTAHGKQYVVIETNNARNRGAPQGCAYVAYALP